MEADGDAAARIGREGVLQRVGHQLVDDQSHGQHVRQGHVGGVDVDVHADAVGRDLPQVANQGHKVAPHVRGGHVVQTVVGTSHGGDPADHPVGESTHLLRPRLAHLHAHEAEDELQVVLDAVMDLSQQPLLTLHGLGQLAGLLALRLLEGPTAADVAGNHHEARPVLLPLRHPAHAHLDPQEPVALIVDLHVDGGGLRRGTGVGFGAHDRLQGRLRGLRVALRRRQGAVGARVVAGELADRRRHVEDSLVLVHGPDHVLHRLRQQPVAALAGDQGLGALCHLRFQTQAVAGQLQEDTHLGQQDLGHEGLDDVVHGPHVVAVELVLLVGVGGADEDDGHLRRVGVAAQQLGDLVAVHLRHLHVEDDQGEIVPQGQLQGFLAAVGPQDHDPRVGEDLLQGHEVGGTIIDDEDPQPETGAGWRRCGLVGHGDTFFL